MTSNRDHSISLKFTTDLASRTKVSVDLKELCVRKGLKFTGREKVDNSSVSFYIKISGPFEKLKPFHAAFNNWMKAVKK